MKKRDWILLVLAALIMVVTFGLLVPAGFFKSINPHFDGAPIAIYTTAYGTEDLAVDHDNGLLFISSANRRIKRSDATPGNGIYLLDLNTEGAVPHILPTDSEMDMNPHGISLVKEDSTTYLYVINHRTDGHFIELFKFSNDSILIQEPFSNALMVSPNDILGISSSEFYITNDHSSMDQNQQTKEDFLRFNNRNVVHYLDGQYTVAAEDLAMPNGINISHSGELLHVTTTLGQEFITYSREPLTGKLKEINRKNIDSGLDNIDVDVEGNIWIGSHPKLLTFMEHAADANKLSPSQIFKLSPTTTIGTYDVEEVYLEDGSSISASSVGVHYKGDLLIGAVFDKKIYRGRFH